MRALSQADKQKLAYLVFDGHRLVAAFAMRDDAEHWIEECGSLAMKLRENRASSEPPRSKRKRGSKSGE